jgi:RES domain-containing protein
VCYFRVTPQRDVGRAFDGLGAASSPGRWNPRGKRAVYLSTRLSLALLEVLVQDSTSSLNGYGFYTVEIPADARLGTIDLDQLSLTWRTARVGRAQCREHVQPWWDGQHPLGFIVPSAVMPEAFPYGDFNVVIDPGSVDFGRLTIGGFTALTIDERLNTIISPSI